MLVGIEVCQAIIREPAKHGLQKHREVCDELGKRSFGPDDAGVIVRKTKAGDFPGTNALVLLDLRDQLLVELLALRKEFFNDVDCTPVQ